MGLWACGLRGLVCLGENFFVWWGVCFVCVLGFVFCLVCEGGCVWVGFGAVSMLSKVTFDVVKSDVYYGASLLVLGERISEEEGGSRLAPSSTEHVLLRQ